MGCNIPVLFLYALDTYENELEEIFSHFLDKCDETVGQSLISKKHFPIVEKVIAAKAYKVNLTNCVVFSIDLDRTKNVEMSYPLDVEVKPLRKEHVKNIYENQPESVQYVFNMEEFENRLELDNEFAVGVFCKKTGRLLSRCMRSHDGSICSLHTVKEARGKGYAKLLLKHVSTKLAELSIIPYLLTDARNEEGMRVVQTSGFHVVTHVVCAVIGKSAASTPLKANECRSANE